MFTSLTTKGHLTTPRLPRPMTDPIWRVGFSDGHHKSTPDAIPCEMQPLAGNIPANRSLPGLMRCMIGICLDRTRVILKSPSPP